MVDTMESSDIENGSVASSTGAIESHEGSLGPSRLEINMDTDPTTLGLPGPLWFHLKNKVEQFEQSNLLLHDARGFFLGSIIAFLLQAYSSWQHGTEKLAEIPVFYLFLFAAFVCALFFVFIILYDQLQFKTNGQNNTNILKDMDVYESLYMGRKV
jgi:hypothetical protein